MLPGGGGGGGQHDCPKQDHPPATGRRDKDTALVVYQRTKKRQAVAAPSLSEGPLVEILSRVPYRSLCRFKCVSKAWLALCSAPDIRKRSPQTLSGFFHNLRSSRGDLRFHNLSGRGPPLVDPALHFLRAVYDRFKVEQCNNSLLLCKCWKSCPEEDDDEMDLVVCNPATGEWTVLPPMLLSDEEAYLGVDAAFPSRFAVFVAPRGCLDNVVIYSSQTGRWNQTGWDYGAVPIVTAECVFLNDLMHLVIDEPYIVAVHTQGNRENWKRIPLPEDMEPSNGLNSMGQSQGLLHAWYIDPDEYQLSVWVLVEYDSHNWILKHTVNVQELFDAEGEGGYYEVFAIHPEQNLIYITDGEETTLSYDMDNEKVHVMCTSGEFLGGLPYIPFFGQWLSHGL